jgi:hypothetical protein
MSRKPNCSYHIGSSTEISAKYNDFCTKVQNVLIMGTLPDKHNVGFKTCGISGGYWRIQRDRRIGPTYGKLQVATSNGICGACFGFLNKALLLTKNQQPITITDFPPIVSATTVHLPSTHLVEEDTESMEEIVENFTCSVPDSFRCPINMTIMRNPVICSDGHSYEKSAIQEWFKKSNKSPQTNLVLENQILIPNHSLRKSIEEFIQHNTKTNS